MPRHGCLPIVMLTVASWAATCCGQLQLDWPQFRGPGASGVAKDQNPPLEIGPETNVRWKAEVPSGLSSPIVVGDMLVLTALENEQLFTIAYDRADGAERWRARAPADQIEPYHQTEGSPAASTPATDGQRIVSYFGSCGLICYDLAGAELWKYQLPVANTIADFGTGVSPVIADGKVVLLRDELSSPKILAVDLESGELAWEQPRQSTSGFSTPAVWRGPEGAQVAAPGFGRMIGYDLGSGAERWHVVGMPSACCPTPVVEDDKLYFAGWSPGGSDDAQNQLPSYDDMLKQSDGDADGVITKQEAEGSFLASMFSAFDMNKNGEFTRAEADTVRDFMAQSKGSAFALKLGGVGDVSETHVMWRRKKGLPYVPSGIVYRGQYVTVKDGGVVTAYDVETGEELYRKRAVAADSYYASPVAAAGRIYFTSLKEGVITVLEAGADSPEVLFQSEPLGQRIGATPAIADDVMYLRTAGRLYAFGQEQ